jgi:hypothetical protein
MLMEREVGCLQKTARILAENARMLQDSVADLDPGSGIRIREGNKIRIRDLEWTF